MDPFGLPGSVEATLGAYHASSRRTLVPLLAYKGPFLAEWFGEIIRHEEDADVREALAGIARDTLRETIEILATMSAWEQTRIDPSPEHGRLLQRRAIHDLLRLKEGSSEVVLLTGMQAPTQELRARLVALADRDREHADLLRRLLGSGALASLRARPQGDGQLGAHEGRTHGSTLAASVRARVREMEESGVRVDRLVLSAVSLRHLRDEGEVKPDGTALGLPVDVDFGWRGEGFALVTDARASLAEVVSAGLLDQD